MTDRPKDPRDPEFRLLPDNAPLNVRRNLRDKTDPKNIVAFCIHCKTPIWIWQAHLRDDVLQTHEHIRCASTKDQERVHNFLAMVREAKEAEMRYRAELAKRGGLLDAAGNPIQQPNRN